MMAVSVVPREEPEGFDAFWILYPRKAAKLDARKAWAALDTDLHVPVIVAVASWRRIWLIRGDMQYVPLPASWLRGERWEDELPSNGSRPAAASHVVFGKVEPPAPRGEIPEHIRAQIRKLTGK